jgi:hypothetical protein
LGRLVPQSASSTCCRLRATGASRPAAGVRRRRRLVADEGRGRRPRRRRYGTSSACR